MILHPGDKLNLVMICALRSGASGFPRGERGAGTAESTARTAQMITSLKRGGKVFELRSEKPRSRNSQRRSSMSLRNGSPFNANDLRS